MRIQAETETLQLGKLCRESSDFSQTDRSSLTLDSFPMTEALKSRALCVFTYGFPWPFMFPPVRVATKSFQICVEVHTGLTWVYLFIHIVLTRQRCHRP